MSAAVAAPYVNPFSQRELGSILKPDEHPILHDAVNIEGGLCEYVCNLLLSLNLLDVPLSRDLKKQITVDNLNTPDILSSHVMGLFTVAEQADAFRSSLYPHNIFSQEEQLKLVQRVSSDYLVNQDLLGEGLKKLRDGQCLKVSVIAKSDKLWGHSVVIKKVAEGRFIFFDPNYGEFGNIDLAELCHHINIALANESARAPKSCDLFFMPYEDFQARWETRLKTSAAAAATAVAAAPKEAVAVEVAA